MEVDSYLKHKLKAKYGDEQVLIVPFKTAREVPDKFVKNVSKAFSWDIQTQGKFVYRYDAEYNKALVQIIPYVVVFNSKGEIFTAQRTDKAEERLVGNLIVGFGGHINPSDMGIDTVYNGAIRELKEELVIDDLTSLRQIGTVRDMTSSTSEHLGIVFTLNNDNVEIRERDNLIGSWMTLQQLVNNYSKFESWARYLIDHLFVNKHF